MLLSGNNGIYPLLHQFSFLPYMEAGSKLDASHSGRIYRSDCQIPGLGLNLDSEEYSYALNDYWSFTPLDKDLSGNLLLDS